MRLILFGAFFTGLTSVCLGLMIVQALRLPVARWEARLLGFLLGAAGLNLLVFGSTAMWMARPWWFATVGGAAIAGCLWRGAWRYGFEVPMDRLPVRWRWMFTLGLIAYGTYSFIHAMAPEMSPDGATYHLGTVARYLRDGGFTRYTGSMYAHLPMGVEMLFLFAYAFGKHSAAALVHWQFYMVLPLLLLAFSKRFGCSKAGAIAGLLVFFSPVVGIDGASAYVDVAVGTVAFGLFYVLLIWEQQRTRGLLVTAGILAGYCYACKMTAFAAVPFAVLFVAWTLWRKREAWFAQSATVALAAAVLILPWMTKNVVMTGNPVAPFLNRWFPNPYMTPWFEGEYGKSLRDYDGTIKSPREIPLEVTVGGGKLNGFLGPVFLLAPLGLLSLRWAVGRRALLASLVFLAAYPGNIGTRFLLLPLPFIALSMALVLAKWQSAGTVAVLFHALFSWPSMTALYCSPYAWHLSDFRDKAAFRIQREEEFLRERMQEYPMARFVEELVPPDGTVLSFSGVPVAYTSRKVLVVYESAHGWVMGDAVMAAMNVDLQPTRRWEFRFPERKTRKLRVVQTKTTDNLWSIAELRVFSDGSEQKRDDGWRVRSNPNPWDVQLAFDNCLITRWRSWDFAWSGMFVEVDFGRELPVSEIRIDASPDQTTSARVEVETSPGKWEGVADAPVITQQGEVESARRIATDDLKRLGITHIMVSNSDFLATEFLRESPAWGVTMVAETPIARLYRIN